MRDTDHGGTTFPKFVDRLMAYVDEQGSDAARIGDGMPMPPFPAEDNEMFAYLVNRAFEILEDEGSRGAIFWLGAHAWYEGALAMQFGTQEPV